MDLLSYYSAVSVACEAEFCGTSVEHWQQFLPYFMTSPLSCFSFLESGTNSMK